VTLNLDFKKGHGVIFMPIDALNVLCAQLTRDLLAIAKFLLIKLFLPENKCSILFRSLIESPGDLTKYDIANDFE